MNEWLLKEPVSSERHLAILRRLKIQEAKKKYCIYFECQVARFSGMKNMIDRYAGISHKNRNCGRLSIRAQVIIHFQTSSSSIFAACRVLARNIYFSGL